MVTTRAANGEATPPHRFFERLGPEPLIIAHRGYRACYPENTLLSFTRSLGLCRMIELDVQFSADGVAVVFHDQKLTRTSNAKVVAKDLGLTSLALCDWQLAQLHRLDLGSWFLDTDPFATLRHGMVERAQLAALMPQRILTLEETLAWAVAHGVPLNIEIKDLGRARVAGLVAAEVIRDIRAAEATSEVIISSFNHEYLRCCRQLAPEIATAALQAGTHPSDLVSYLQALGVSAYHPENAITDAALVKTLRAAGLAVNVFTVNDPTRQHQLFGFGVTGIFTDFLETVTDLPLAASDATI